MVHVFSSVWPGTRPAHGSATLPNRPSGASIPVAPTLTVIMDIEYDDLEPGVSPDERQRGVRRIAQIVIGVLLVAAGIVMLVIPGPGIVTILVGLNLIRPDNALVRYIRRRVPGIPEDGTVPMRFVVVGAVFLVGGTVIGVLYGADLTNWALELVGIR